MEVAPSPLLPSSGSGGGEWPAESLGDGHMPWAFMGYEQLLSIQQHQHRLELEQKDAENAHLKACLDFLDVRHAPGAGAVPEDLIEPLRTQEEAATLLMAAKHKELELMVGLLQLREQQIEDFRQLCEAQGSEIQQLKGEGGDIGGSTVLATMDGSSPHRAGAHGKDEHQQLQREVRRLRLRMEELEGAMSEQTHLSAGLANELEAKSDRVKVLEEQVRHIRSPGHVWPGNARSPTGSVGEFSPGFGAGAGAGSVAGSYVMDAMAPLDDMDQARFVSPHVRHHTHDHRAHAHRGHAEHLHGYHHSQHQTPAASSFGASPPSLALPPLQHSVPHCVAGSEAVATSARQPPTGSVDEAAEAAAAAYLLARSTERRVLAEAEASAVATGSRPPSPRPASPRQLSPPHANRHIHHYDRAGYSQGTAPAVTMNGSTLDAMALRRLGEESHRQPPGPMDLMGTHLIISSETMDLTQSHNMSISGQSQVQSYHSAVRTDAMLPADANDPAPARSPQNSSWNAGATPSEGAETSRQSQELLNEMRRLRQQMSELERVAGSRQVVPAATPAGQHQAARNHASPRDRPIVEPPAAFGEPSSSGGERWHVKEESVAHGGDALAPAGVPSSSAGWEYRAHTSGDPIDAAVATLVNRPGRYRGWRALLCRLEQGVYLCGTRRVHLRADLAQERIEASDDAGATWSDLEVLMKGAEASQRALLERARDSAGMAA